MRDQATFCRICESACGLVATVDGDRIVGLRPDPEHPLSAGHACIKGTRYGDVHHHERRTLTPQWRASRDQAFKSTTWDEALASVGGRLQTLITDHGPESVGLYLGNAAAHSLSPILGATALQRALGTTKSYSSLTLDNAPMFVVTEACLGNPMLTFVADYGGADCIVLVGTDPLSSQPSQAQSNPKGVRELVQAADHLVVVDPRRSITAAKAALHLQPRPGTDAALLAFLVRAVLQRRRPVDELLDDDDLDALAQAVDPWTARKTADATGLTPAELADLAERLLAAERPLVWSGLGVLLGPDGTVGYWLTLALQAVLGGLDRPGGWLQNRGAIDLPKLFAKLGIAGSDPHLRSRTGDIPATLGTLPAATLADDILTPGPRQLRALIVVGGNPALSLPDAARARQALEHLELLVSVDLFVNDTGTLADVVLPAADWLERSDVGLHMASQRRIPHLQHAAPVVPPRGQVREDWTILCDIARAAGRRPFGSALADAALRWTRSDPTSLAAHVVRWMAPFSWRALTGAERGLVAPAAPTLRVRGTDRADGRLLLAVPEFLEALSQGLGPEPAPEHGRPLQLITSVRTNPTMNTWLHGLAGGRLTEPVARLHPADREALGLTEGSMIELGPPGRAIVRWVEDPGQREGTITLPFGWGHLPGSVAANAGRGGVNVNALIGTERLERFTGQPCSNGGWVVARAKLSTRPDESGPEPGYLPPGS